MKEIVATPLTPDSFAPFGRLLEQPARKPVLLASGDQQQQYQLDYWDRVLPLLDEIGETPSEIQPLFRPGSGPGPCGCASRSSSTVLLSRTFMGPAPEQAIWGETSVAQR